MDCKITCFERVLHLVKPLPKEKFKKCIEIIQEDSFIVFLDYCINNNCFSEEQSNTLYGGVVMWKDLESNYYEEDYNKLYLLYDKVGVTEEIFEKFSK